MEKNASVYSYLRFSDARQSAGSSADRQAQYAARWAKERSLPLDESLSLRDEGLSAYHQRHVKQGALGTFLKAVDEGRIAPGSVLVVEGLDRLSRAEPIQAQAQLAQIINAGITVVTASDGREYNRERLKANPMDLVYSLLVMIRAHEESDTKSKRVKAAIRRQCEQWLAGTSYPSVPAMQVDLHQDLDTRNWGFCAFLTRKNQRMQVRANNRQHRRKPLHLPIAICNTNMPYVSFCVSSMSSNNGLNILSCSRSSICSHNAMFITKIRRTDGLSILATIFIVIRQAH